MPRHARLAHLAGRTTYQWTRLCQRFDAYRQGRPLAETVQGWLDTLPPSQQATARGALRAHFGRMAMDWAGLRVARYHRNEATLQASVLLESQRAQIRAIATHPRDRALIEILWTVRRAEAAALTWRAIDLSRGMVYVYRGKGNKSSWTMLLPVAQAALVAWFQAAGEPPDTAPVFPSTPGGTKPYGPNALGLVVQKLLQRAGCWTPGIGACHRWRRTFATTYLRENPSDLVGLQTLMRHSQIGTTQRYCFLRPDDLAPRVNRVRL